MAISYVAAGTTFTNTGSGTTWTWNKPAGVASGDIMIASVQCQPGGQKVETLPSGWTLVRDTYRNGSFDDGQQVVAYRIAGSSEPASWGGSFSGSVQRIAAGITAYRGVQGVGASGSSSVDGGTSLSTATVSTGSVSGPWRVVCGAYISASSTYTISSNEITRRTLVTSGNATQGAIWDSNGTISSGTTTSRTISRGAAWSLALSCILILTPQTGTPASGTAALTLPAATATTTAAVSIPGTAAMTVSAVTSSFAGLGQPLEGTGTVSTAIPPVSASVAGLTDVRGTLDTILPIGVDIDAETRAHGVRVINVEADDRTIRVESRAVAD